MIFECKKCKKQFNDSLDKLSGFTATIKIPQFNKTTDRATDHSVHSAALIGICRDCVKRAIQKASENLDESDKDFNSKFLGELVKLIFINNNEQEYYTEKKL
ncbi:MAG: hypothetical protein ACW99F_18670 [Candidatus Hodarchaeales archaeon]|jgi:hypothetical protein